jgi:hypothetical protein
MKFILLAAISVIAFGFIAYGLEKGASSHKIMLLGINITIFGGIIAVDPNSSLGGIEYIISLCGLLISLMGFAKKD